VGTRHTSFDFHSRISQHISLDSHSRMLLGSGLFFSQNVLKLFSSSNSIDTRLKCGCDEDFVSSGLSTIIVFRLLAMTSPIELQLLEVKTSVVSCTLLSPASSFGHLLVFRSHASVFTSLAARSNWSVACLSKMFFQHSSGSSVSSSLLILFRSGCSVSLLS